MMCIENLKDITLDCDYKPVRGLKHRILVIPYKYIDRARTTLNDEKTAITHLQLRPNRRGYLFELSTAFKVNGSQKLSDGFVHEFSMKINKVDEGNIGVVNALQRGSYVLVIETKCNSFEVLGYDAGMVLTSVQRDYEGNVIGIAFTTPNDVKERRMILHTTEKEAGKVYVENATIFLRGTGFNRHTAPIIQINGTNIAPDDYRGLYLVVINRATMEVLFKQSYDTYATNEDVKTLVDKLNSLKDDVLVALVSRDSAGGYLNINDVLNALYRCGASVTSLKGQQPYAFLGIPDIGKGNGIEVYTDNTRNAPYAEITTKVINGVPQGISYKALDLIGDYNAGGRNLILKSKHRVTKRATESGWVENYILSENLVAGSTYILTYKNYGEKNRPFLWSGIWEKAQEIFSGMPFVAKENYKILNIHTTEINVYDFELLKLERGNVATDWTPAPEDK